MKLDKSYKPEFESLKALLLEMAQERSVDVLLNLIVSRMSKRPHVALVRIWLTREGDICNECSMSENCRNRSGCLHLVVSGGSSISDASPDWSDLEGYGKRIPLGHTGIGKIAETGKALTRDEIRQDREWQNRENWAPGEKILGFGGQPLLYKDDVLGVIAIYSRIESGRIQEGRFWLKMISNLTASAIANAQAFSEIDLLKSQLELENTYLREELEHALAFGDIIGKSPQLMNIQNQIELVAPTDASVFIFGESGTGKELVAREIHKRS